MEHKIQDNTFDDSIMSEQQFISYDEELTTFDDTVGEECERAPRTYGIENSDPYEDQGMSKVLSRVYKVSHNLWDSTMLPGHIVTYLPFPQLLKDKANIAAKLKNFRYLRAGVKVHFKLNTTMKHFGRLLVCYVPRTGLIDLEGGVFAASRYPHVIISADSQESVELEIPFINPYLWLENDESTISPEIATVFVYVLHPLGNSEVSSTQTVHLTAFANFESPEVAGLYAEDLEAQGDFKQEKSDKETQQKTERGILGNIAHTIGDVSGGLTKVPLIGGIATVVSPIAKLFGGLFDFFGLEKPTSIEAPNHTILGYGMGLAQSRGLDVSKRFTIDPTCTISSNMDDIPSPLQDEMSLKRIMMTPCLLDIFSFNGTLPVDEMVYEKDVTPLSYSDTQPNATTWHSLYCTDVALNFQYWRGTMKYYFMFTTGKFTSARVRISWFPEIQDPAPDSDGDYISHVLDIMGDTRFAFCVPFIDSRAYLNTDGTADISANGKIYVTLINPPITGDSVETSVIHVAVFAAAGEDMQVFGLRGLPQGISYAPAPANMLVEENEPEILEAQTSMRSVFSETFAPLKMAFAPIINSYVMGEEVTSVKDIVLRPVQIGTTTWTQGSFFRYDNEFQSLYSILRLFRYGRMTRRLKIFLQVPRDQNHTLIQGSLTFTPNTYNTPLSGRNIWNTEYNPSIEFEVPRYHYRLFDGNTNSAHSCLAGDTGPTMQVELIRLDSTYPLPVIQYNSVGDDSGFAFLQWPGYVIIS